MSSDLISKHVDEPWFSEICADRKVVEGRLNVGAYATIRADAVIEFINTQFPSRPRSVRVKILKRVEYKSFREMLEIEGLSRCLPCESVTTIDQGVAVYRRYYEREDEMSYGVVAFHILTL